MGLKKKRAKRKAARKAEESVDLFRPSRAPAPIDHPLMRRATSFSQKRNAAARAKRTAG